MRVLSPLERKESSWLSWRFRDLFSWDGGGGRKGGAHMTEKGRGGRGGVEGLPPLIAAMCSFPRDSFDMPVGFSPRPSRGEPDSRPGRPTARQLRPITLIANLQLPCCYITTRAGGITFPLRRYKDSHFETCVDRERA